MVLDSTAIEVEQTELDAGDLSAVTKAQAGMYPAAYEQFRQDDDIREWEYKILKAEANAKISGAILHENFSRLTRAIFLRDTKRKLKPLKLWSRWCRSQWARALGSACSHALLQIWAKYSQVCGATDKRDSHKWVGNGVRYAKGHAGLGLI